MLLIAPEGPKEKEGNNERKDVKRFPFKGNHFCNRFIGYGNLFKNYMPIFSELIGKYIHF